MAATIQIGAIIAIIRDQEVTCQDAKIKELIKGISHDQQPVGWDPNPDLSLANAAIQMLGGRILQFDEPTYNNDPDIVY